MRVSRRKNECFVLLTEPAPDRRLSLASKQDLVNESIVHFSCVTVQLCFASKLEYNPNCDTFSAPGL